MSLHINWNELLANDSLRVDLQRQLESLLESKLNEKAEGEIDDGTRLHVLELNFGNQPPMVELVRLGMDEEKKEEQLATTAAAVVAQPSPQQQHHLQNVDANTPRGSARASPTPFEPRRSSSRSSLSSSSSSTSLASSLSSSAHLPPLPATPSRPVTPLRCATCGGILPVASTPLPSVSLCGRVAYEGSGYITLQVRRQVNPIVSKRALIGRVAAKHLSVSSMHWPTYIEIWIRIGELRIDGEISLTYTPGQKAVSLHKRTGTSSSSNPATAGHSRAPSALASPIALHYARSRSATPAPTSSPRPSAHHPAATFRSPHAASPAPSHHSASSSLSNSGLFSPGDLHAHCTCPPSVATPNSSVSATGVSKPAWASVLLAQNPLHHISITSSLDGSPAGVKLVSTFQTQIQQALKKVVGQKIQFEIPQTKK